MSLAKSWFDHTFSSPHRTEQLLRPDLESGLLSQHDFDLAVAFLPGYHRYLPYIHTVIWGAAAGFTLYRFKPKVRFPTTVLGLSAVSGYGFGLFHYFREHRNFARQLDDRQTFLLVLDNVNKRLGNPTPLFPQLDSNKILESVMKRKRENGEVLSPGAETFGDASEHAAADGTMPSPSVAPAFQAPEQSPTRHQSAWDAIRGANARSSGKHSSWDELRQRHERQRVPERPSQETQKSASELDDPRTKAQAEFDAILEAERKAASGSAAV